MRVLLRSAFSPMSGYGNDGIGIAQALLRAGVEVVIQPLHVDAPLPRDVAALFTRPVTPPFDVCVNHADPYLLGVGPEVRPVSGLVIGWTMWEYTSFEAEEELRRANGERVHWDKRAGTLDAVISYDPICDDAITAQLPGLAHGVAQGGYDPRRWKSVARDWTDPEHFRFAMVGLLHERKDPFVAIEAFKQLKDEKPGAWPDGFDGAELHLKTSVPGLHSSLESWCPKLRVHYAVWPEDVLTAFYGQMHVLLAPSRGEGKNMPALEFMSTGGTVIATNWGGHRGWLDDGWAYKLDYTLATETGASTTFSARASVEHLKTLMWKAYTDRAGARRRGDLAQQVIPQMCSWDKAMDTFFAAVAKAVPGRGEAIYNAWRLAGVAAGQ